MPLSKLLPPGLPPCPQVAPNDLRVITKRPNGTVTQKVRAGCTAAQRGWRRLSSNLTQLKQPAVHPLRGPALPSEPTTLPHPPICVPPQVISQVRFSDLEVPSEAEVLLATLRCERRQRTAPADHPSTFADDVAAIVAASPASTPSAAAGNGCTFAPSPMPTPCGSFSEAPGAFMPGSSPGSAGVRGGAVCPGWALCLQDVCLWGASCCLGLC